MFGEYNFFTFCPVYEFANADGLVSILRFFKSKIVYYSNLKNFAAKKRNMQMWEDAHRRSCTPTRKYRNFQRAKIRVRNCCNQTHMLRGSQLRYIIFMWPLHVLNFPNTILAPARGVRATPPCFPH